VASRKFTVGMENGRRNASPYRMQFGGHTQVYPDKKVTYPTARAIHEPPAAL